MLGFKAETKAPMKISVTNGYTTGTEAAFNDIYNSIYTVGIETEKDLLLSNLPLSTSVLGSIAIDKITTGNGNTINNLVTGVDSEVIGQKLPNTPTGILLREVSTKFIEKTINNIADKENK